MSFAGGEDAANDRWAMEQAAMEDYEKQSYAQMPQYPVSERIPRFRTPRLQTYGLNKQEIPEYSTDGLKVYSINGAYIRDRYADESIGDRKGVDFLGGGHSAVYWKIIPEDEIWIEQNLHGRDRDAFIVHEIEERQQMLGKGMDYSEAHNDYANKVEIEARENPHEMDEMLAEMLEKHREEHAKKQSKQTVREYNGRRINPMRNGVLRDRFYLGRKLPAISAGGV